MGCRRGWMVGSSVLAAVTLLAARLPQTGFRLFLSLSLRLGRWSMWSEAEVLTPGKTTTTTENKKVPQHLQEIYNKRKINPRLPHRTSLFKNSSSAKSTLVCAPQIVEPTPSSVSLHHQPWGGWLLSTFKNPYNPARMFSISTSGLLFLLWASSRFFWHLQK